MKAATVVCFGEMLWDQLPAGPVPGGAPMNVAIHLKQLGVESDLVSRVGNDSAGRALTDFIIDRGIPGSFIQIDPKLPTGEVLIQLDHNKQPVYEICKPVAWDNIQCDEQLLSQTAAAGSFLFGSLAARSPESRKTLLSCLDHAKYKIFDVNLRPPFDDMDVVEILMSKANMVKLNEDELKRIATRQGLHDDRYEHLLEKILNRFELRLICLTLGADGAMVFDGHDFFRHAAFPVTVVDAVGAGDGFLAGFLGRYLKNNDIAWALAFGCAMGAYVASGSGATPKLNPGIIEKIVSGETTLI